MGLKAEVRYYEIRFIKLINQFFNIYKLDKLLTFNEMLTFVTGADLNILKTAMQRVIANDTKVRINREEYIICLKLFSGLNNTQLRQVARCSPNTIINAMEVYDKKQIFIQPKFDLVQSDEIRKVMKSLNDIANIY